MRAMIISLGARLEIAKGESGKPQLHREKLDRGEVTSNLKWARGNYNQYMPEWPRVAVSLQMFSENV